MDEPEIALQFTANAPHRREPREPVEMMAKLRNAFMTCTVVLKDLTRFGARIEGIHALKIDEAVNLGLPGCRPAMAFVIWQDRYGAGLEFAEPLEEALYAKLIVQHGLGRQNNPAQNDPTQNKPTLRMYPAS